MCRYESIQSLIGLPEPMAMEIAKESLTAYASGSAWTTALFEIDARLSLLFKYGVVETEKEGELEYVSYHRR